MATPPFPAGAADAVEREIHIAAPPERVFPFFTDPDKIVQWKGVSAEADPRPGGIYRVNVTGRDIVRGRFVEVVPNTRVVFTWGWEGPNQPLSPGSSTVEVTLIADGGGTIVRLRHSGLTTQELRDSHAQGWEHFLTRLTAAGAGEDPGPDPWVTQAMDA
ncbi:MAG: SRPBCC family protein [Chloroflexi bacterium]|nr:SRPBCC family protein [Chloroflexota bacterium]